MPPNDQTKLGRPAGLFMSHHSIVLGGDTEWLEEVSETHYHAAVTQRHANHVRF